MVENIINWIATNWELSLGVASILISFGGLLVSMCSLWKSHKSNRESEKANEISERANKQSERANKLSEKSNNIAIKTNKKAENLEKEQLFNDFYHFVYEIFNDFNRVEEIYIKGHYTSAYNEITEIIQVLRGKNTTGYKIPTKSFNFIADLKEKLKKLRELLPCYDDESKEDREKKKGEADELLKEIRCFIDYHNFT